MKKKLLFKATQIQYSSSILTTQFKVRKDNWFGLGVYFSDQFDYIQYYYSSLFEFLPKLTQSFSVIATEIYYDRNKFKRIYNKDDYCVVLNNLPSDHEINVIKIKQLKKMEFIM